MTVLRSPARRLTVVDRASVAGFVRPAARSVSRPCPTSPPMRRQDPPDGPSRRDVLRRWEEADEWSCTYCDASFGPMVVAEVDHVIPLAKGGVHTMSNLTPACAECNRAKSDLDMSDWMAILAGQMDTEREVTVTR